MGPLQSAAMAVGKEVSGSENFFTSTVGAISNLIGKASGASQTAIGQDALQTFFASKAAQALTGSGDFNQALSRDTGAVFNSNTELLFSGVSLRSGFSF
jgi:hypothetical protein